MAIIWTLYVFKAKGENVFVILDDTGKEDNVKYMKVYITQPPAPAPHKKKQKNKHQQSKAKI